MTKKIAGKAMFVGRATVFAVGLAMILAVVLGVASSALAANGQPFILGKGNVATKVSTLVKKGVGPALGLKVGVGQAPLTVNPEAGTATNLSADELDGKDAGAFLGASEKAASAASADDANTLDGVDSTAFARTTSEAWRQVDAGGQPAFGNGLQPTPMWQNFDTAHNSAGFYKDSTGTVHLKGAGDVHKQHGQHRHRAARLQHQQRRVHAPAGLPSRGQGGAPERQQRRPAPHQRGQQRRDLPLQPDPRLGRRRVGVPRRHQLPGSELEDR